MKAYAANYWVSKGADPRKMTIGLPLYGRTFTLRNKDDSSLGAEAKAGGKEGKFTREEGYLAYYEVQYGGLSVPSMYFRVYPAAMKLNKNGC